MSAENNINGMVFAGGGSRCIWQLGFFSALPKEFKKRIKNVSCVSAGSFMSCIAFADIIDECIEYFREITEKNKKNFYPDRVFKNEPAFPHYEMYRGAVINLFTDELFEKVKKGPKINILAAYPPKRIHPVLATMAGFLVYSTEKKVNNPIHPKWTKKTGFSEDITLVENIDSIEGLADSILRSSCTPPFLPMLKKENKFILDGGLIDNVPAWILDETKGKKLILLSRKYPFEDIMEKNDRVYVQPSKPVEIKRWDYSNPRGIDETFQLGIEDGKSFTKNYLSKN